MSLPIVLPARRRRLLQAVVYEGIALALVTPVVARLFDHPPLSSFLLSIVMSTIALAWNYGFNTAFERWEARQPPGPRRWVRRLAHGVGFEVGLAAILVPLMAVWLRVSLWQALMADAGLIAFFFFYTVGFTWAFDRVFALPTERRRA
jgi:uncharacterized membrane protein